MRQPTAAPTCPRCGHHTTTIRVDHPGGTWFCTCGQLFFGTETEWRRLTKERRELQEREQGLRPPIKAQARLPMSVHPDRRAGPTEPTSEED